MKYAHGVIDLETLGNTPQSPIIQIGISMPDEQGNPGAEVFNGKIEHDPEGGYEPFKSDQSTVDWWAHEDRNEPFEMIFRDTDQIGKRGYVYTLGMMNNFIRNYKESYGVDEVYLWSHATFDPPILVNALNQTEKQLNKFRSMVHFRNFRDFRTTDWILGAAHTGFIYSIVDKRVAGMNLVHHYAPHDAIYEHHILNLQMETLRQNFDVAEEIPTDHLHLFGNIEVPSE